MAESTSIIFEFRGTTFKGYLNQVFGSGGSVWYLMIDNYYCGRLRIAENNWVFDPTPKTEGFKQLAALFGEVVTGKNL